MRPPKKVANAFACILVSLLVSCSNESQERRYQKVHPQMGTTFEITLFASSAEQAEAAAGVLDDPPHAGS